jgi:hypothetical protein
MGASALSPKLPDRAAISPLLLNACLALFLVNAAFFMVMSVSDQWIVDPQGLGIPTDFINVWSAGWLVLQGQPATAYDWDIQKQAEAAVLGREYVEILPGTIRRRFFSSRLFGRISLTWWPSSGGRPQVWCRICWSCARSSDVRSGCFWRWHFRSSSPTRWSGRMAS